MKKTEFNDPEQELQVILTEGVHFYNVQAYFLELVHNFCIFSWFSDDRKFSLIKKQLKSTQKQQTVTYIHGTLSNNNLVKALILREEKLLHKNEIMYSWIEDQNPRPFKKKTDFRICLKIEVQLGLQQKTTQNLIKILFLNYRDSQNTSLAFPDLQEKGKKVYGFKPNFCNLSNPKDIVYPKFRQIYTSAQTHMAEKELILLVNQNNMKQMPFFQNLFQNLVKSGTRVTKIIGHPMNLFLSFLVDEDHSFNQKIGHILCNYKNYEVKRTIKRQSNQNRADIAERLSGIILKVFGQQNLLQPSFIQFFAQNLVNEEFEQNFIELVRLYYKILLDEQLEKQQIRAAIIDNFFISPQEQIRNSSNNFTSLLKFLEFKHDLIVRDVLLAINRQVKIKTKKEITEFTLLDLYNFSQIQYTFIGLDINSQIVRFFNYETTPNLPISAILSLIQILPLPFKSIIWKQQWGKYKINVNIKQRQISLTGHEIIDSKYILQCPLDLIEDPFLRKCYFSSNTHPEAKIQAITPLKINIDDINHTDEVIKLLKAMKNSAIDSLPKIRLVWKVLTTKNLVQIDLNNVQTLYQIPILQKVLKINETSKNFLKNLNFQVNQQRIFTAPLPQYQMFKMDIEGIYYKSQELADFLQKKFIYNSPILFQNKSGAELGEEIKNLRRKLKLIKNITYQQTLWLKARIQNLIKSYDLKQKYVYQQMIHNFSKKLEKNRLIFDINVVESQLQKILAKLAKSQLKTFYKEEEHQALATSTKFRQSYTYVYDQNERNSIQNVLKEVKKFTNQLKKTATAIQPYKYKNSLELQNLEFQRLTYRVSKVIFQIMESKVETQQLQDIYAYFFQISPQLYNLKQILYNKFYTNKLIKNFLVNNQSNMPIHMIIGGKDTSLLMQAHFLLNMRKVIADNEIEKIVKISSSGFHSVLAFLFCLNIDKETIFQELVGLETLVKVKNRINNQQNINIIELLSRTVDSQQKLSFFQTNKKVGQMKMKLLKKYNNLLKIFSQFESNLENGNQYKLIKVYSNIQEFDNFFVDEDVHQKQLQIIQYIQQQMEKGAKKKKSQEILKENEQMLKQKIVLNKIGIKFTIKFLFKDINADLNWENIHKAQYQELYLYKTHVVSLMKKYNVSSEVNLIEFNRTNYHNVKLCFPVMNQTDFRYEVITQDSQPHIKLLDLLITSVTSTVYYGAYPLATKEPISGKQIQKLVNKLQGKLVPNDTQKRYWSCGMFNPLPFNIIQSQCNTEVVLCLNPFNNVEKTIQIRNIPQIRIMKRVSQKQIETRNFRALDLISFWWTKPKKLTPQLKQLMFGNIYQSPFSRLYFFIQNSSYQHLVRKVQKRSTLSLNSPQQHFLKSQIIKDSITQTNTNTQSIYYFKLRHQTDQSGQKTIVQCIKSSKMRKNWLFVNGIQLTQVKKIVIPAKDEHLVFSFYQIQGQSLELLNSKVIVSQFSQFLVFLELIIGHNNEVSFKKLTIQNRKIVKGPIIWDKSYKKWQYYQCKNCGRPFKKKQQLSNPHCILCVKKKQFKLCLFMNYQLNDYIENEPKIFEAEPEPKVRVEKIEKRLSLARLLCCFSCFRSK